jgi:hypothetical protein
MSAATPLPLSVEDYLHTSYRPDCDYVDGGLQERNLGELDHAELQAALVVWLGNHGKAWNIRAVPELRIQVSPTRFRAADVCVMSREAPIEQVPTRPPLAIIEVVDPETRRGFDCSTGNWIETRRFAVPDSPIVVALDVIFAELA